MTKQWKISATALVFALSGCWSSDEPTLPAGNETLGIVSFTEEEAGDQTTLLGLDASGNEIARLELVHGRFTPITSDYSPSQDVEGRQLRAEALGQQMRWETAGFDPVLEMPAHPPSQWKLAAFLADPHAKAILDRWQIGFEPFQGGPDEVGYVSGSFRGDSPMNCNGLTTCGSVQGINIGTCGGMSGTGIIAARVTRQPGSNCGLYTGPAQQEVLLAQCCPSNTGLLGVPWFAQKACPTSGTATSCGIVPGGACKGCPEYPVDARTTCSVSTGATVGSCSSVPVYPINWSYTSSFNDDFNRTSGMGSSWTVSPGGYNTDGNYAVSSTSGQNYARAIPSPALSTNDYFVTAKVTPVAGSFNAGVFARGGASPSSDSYTAGISTDDYVVLRRINGGTATDLEQTHVLINSGTEYEVKLLVTGSSPDPVRLEVWVDGVLKISHTDSSASRHSTGTTGIRCQESGVKYNSFSAGTALALSAVPGLSVEDTFPTAGTSMVGTAGLKWISEWGTVTGDGVFAATSGTAMNYSMPVVNLGTNNYAVQADVQVPAASKWGGVYARASDPEDGANNNYAAQLSTTRIELMRYNNYTYTWLVSYNATFNVGQNYNLKLAVTGSNPVQLTVYLNGSPVITHNDSSGSRITTGDVGIVTKGNSSGVKWDYFKVEAL